MSNGPYSATANESDPIGDLIQIQTSALDAAKARGVDGFWYEGVTANNKLVQLNAPNFEGGDWRFTGAFEGAATSFTYDGLNSTGGYSLIQGGGPRTATVDEIVVTAQLSRKEIIARGGSGYQITVAPNPKADGSAPWYETGVSMVRANEKYIPAAAKKYQVDADLIRSVMFVESSHGYYDYLLQPFDANKSILPMNVNTSYWGNTWGGRESLKDPRANIDAGAKILRSISNAMPGASVAQIATVYNSSNATKVNDYGARVQAVYDAKSWNLPNFSTEQRR